MLKSSEHVHNTKVYLAKADIRSAQASFLSAVASAKTANDFVMMIQIVPALWRGADAVRQYDNIINRIDAFPNIPKENERADFFLVKCSIKLAMNDIAGFEHDARKWLLANHDHPLGPDVSGVLRRTTSPDFPNVQEEKVFAIGLSRTGTTSIHKCLKILGFNSAHFFNPVSRAVLQETDYHLFNAFSDSPVCVNFERLFHRFPNSKFILTTRDLESWTRSIKRHMENIRGSSDWQFLRSAASYSSKNNKPMFGDYDAELYFQYLSFEDAYRAFHHRVDEFFVGNKAHRLVRVDVSKGDAWRQICRFLDRPCPNVDFPWENASNKH